MRRIIAVIAVAAALLGFSSSDSSGTTHGGPCSSKEFDKGCQQHWWPSSGTWSCWCPTVTDKPKGPNA